MADPELEKLRRQRLAQMQSQYQVLLLIIQTTFPNSLIVSILVILLPVAYLYLSVIGATSIFKARYLFARKYCCCRSLILCCKGEVMNRFRVEILKCKTRLSKNS